MEGQRRRRNSDAEDAEETLHDDEEVRKVKESKKAIQLTILSQKVQTAIAVTPLFCLWDDLTS